MDNSLYDKFLECTGVSTDTRKIRKGDMFFALRGPNFDGNRFAKDALAKGAHWVIIDNADFNSNPKCVVVKDSLAALQDLAKIHRSKFNIPFIAITGSNGKTTTKELINAVLSTKYNTIATPGNLNNHIGVPLSVLSVITNTEFAIIEMGANKPGDIKELCGIANPTHGIITNIGKAHIEGFGSLDGVLRTKTELYDYLLRNNGTVFINSLNPVLKNMIKRFSNPVLYPGKNDFFKCDFVKSDPYVIYKDESGSEVETNLIGMYNFDNIAAALCVGKFFEAEVNAANTAVKNYIPSNMRSQVIKRGSNTIILDAYNANPASMEAALHTISEMSADHKVVILGDMLELGNISDEEHTHIGRITEAVKPDEVYFYGKEMENAYEANKASLYFSNKEDLEKFIAGKHFENSIILIKASRGMQLETIINHIH